MHLALRDVYYERATRLLKASKPMQMQELLLPDYEEMLFLLRTARDHGMFATRDGAKNEKDGQFCKFINMLAGNVKAILSMLNLKRSVEAEDGFFLSFLEVNHASVALQAEEYERRARDIICCMHNTLNLASKVYEGLKEANLEAFNAAEKGRYNKASAHYAERMEKGLERPKYKKRAGIFS